MSFSNAQSYCSGHGLALASVHTPIEFAKTYAFYCERAKKTGKMLSKDVFSTVGGNGKDGWVDAVNPTGAECEKAACATKFQTQSGTLIPYDESFDMDAGDSGDTCLKFKDEKPKLEDEDCGDTDRRPICSCDSESLVVRFRS